MYVFLGGRMYKKKGVGCTKKGGSDVRARGSDVQSQGVGCTS